MTDAVEAFLRYQAVERGASAHTLRSYRTDLAQFRRFLGARHVGQLAHVDARLLRQYLARLYEAGLSRASIARKLAAIRSCLAFLTRRGGLPRNPAREVSPPRQGLLRLLQLSPLQVHPVAAAGPGALPDMRSAVPPGALRPREKAPAVLRQRRLRL